MTASWVWIAGDHGGGRRRGRNLALFHVRTRQQGAASAGLEHLPVGFAHRALVAGPDCRVENAGDSVEPLDCTVDPRLADLGRRRVDRDARLAVVERAEDHVGPAVHTQPQVVDDVAAKRPDLDPGVDLGGSRDGRLDLGPAAVLRAEQDRARQV